MTRLRPQWLAEDGIDDNARVRLARPALNVVVIAPHPDDESIGCGGTICLHTQSRGDRVSAVFLTSGELGLKTLATEDARRIREREANDAAEVLGISDVTFLRQPDWYMGENVKAAAAALGPVLEREIPGIIYLPHPGDAHPDHQAALSIVQAALRLTSIESPVLMMYEIWTPMAEHHHVEDITAVLQTKLRAIRCHQSQVALLRYDRAALGLSLYRGAVAGGCRYAEIFAYAEALPAEQNIRAAE